MINMKGRLLPELGQAAVLAAIASPEHDLRMQSRGNLTHGSGAQPATAAE